MTNTIYINFHFFNISIFFWKQSFKNIKPIIGNKRYEEVYPKYELLTTHCGRRTFIVNSLYLGIPAEVVMKWTGHTDYDSMKPYVKIVDELKEESMRKFDEK